jgi:rhomboid family GlyGly-CTERM serine protease
MSRYFCPKVGLAKVSCMTSICPFELHGVKITMKKKGSTWGAIITSVCAVSAVAVLIQTLQPEPFSWRYDRALVLQGEVWRLLSGTWVHLSWAHLGMNVVGLALVLMLFKKKAQSLSALGLLTAIGAVSHTILLAHPGLSWGMGLSGALHGLFLHYTLTYVWADARRFAFVLITGLGLKLLLEAALDTSASAWLGGQQVALPLHWAGTAAGAITAAALALTKRRVTTRDQ